MGNPTKALLLDVQTFLADNNIRRNTASFSVNYGSESEDVSQQTFSILANDTKNCLTPMSLSVVTLLRTTVPLTAHVTLRDNTTFTLVISKLMILDADVASIQLTNNLSSNTAKVSLTQC